ncbi:MAG TPA: hypothetical protein VII01_15775 [Solirubrobacteraceae bacterium]
MKQFESVFTRGLVVAALCLTAGIAEPGRAQETAHGTGKVADTSAFRVAPDAGVVVTGAPSGESSDALSPGPPAGRLALTQPGCTICLVGTGSTQWNGASGSFHVDTITNNRSSGTSGSLDLRVALSSSAPVYGQTLTYFSFSDAISFNPLAAGYQYSNVNSGTVGMYGSSIPVGQYWQLLYLREYSGGTWYYADWIVMPNKLACDGSGCSVVSSCTEDAYTMCLVNGRYRVTGRWKNQYAGGAMATLFKAKLTDTTGAFWIADSNTYEYLIRFNTATNNGRAWVSIPTFTDVEFWVAVTDTVNGQAKEFHSPPGNQTTIYDPNFFFYP